MAPKVDFAGMSVTWIRPSIPLGTVRDALFWKEENARRWIELGEKDVFTTGTQRHGEKLKKTP